MFDFRGSAILTNLSQELTNSLADGQHTVAGLVVTMFNFLGDI